jgi:hypothetical protein
MVLMPNILHESLKLINLRAALCILMQKAAVLNTCRIISFGRTVNKKCVVSEMRTLLRTSKTAVK